MFLKLLGFLGLLGFFLGCAGLVSCSVGQEGPPPPPLSKRGGGGGGGGKAPTQGVNTNP